MKLDSKNSLFSKYEGMQGRASVHLCGRGGLIHSRIPLDYIPIILCLIQIYTTHVFYVMLIISFIYIHIMEFRDIYYRMHRFMCCIIHKVGFYGGRYGSIRITEMFYLMVDVMAQFVSTRCFT